MTVSKYLFVRARLTKSQRRDLQFLPLVQCLLTKSVLRDAMELLLIVPTLSNTERPSMKRTRLLRLSHPSRDKDLKNLVRLHQPTKPSSLQDKEARLPSPKNLQELRMILLVDSVTMMVVNKKRVLLRRDYVESLTKY